MSIQGELCRADKQKTVFQKQILNSDTNLCYFSAPMSPAALIKLGENVEYSEDSSIVSSTDSNIYEVIEHATPECSEQGSLYLNISRGRRDHLKLHRGGGWDCGGGHFHHKPLLWKWG